MKAPLPTKEQQGGYMLVEIMVSLMIFTMVAVASATALLSIVDANSKAQALKAVMDNLSVAVENISRTVRIGTDIKCLPVSAGGSLGTEAQDITTCREGTKGISFLPQDASDTTDRLQYYFKETIDAEGKTKGAIYRNRNSQEVALTAPEVIINNVTFYVLASGTTTVQSTVSSDIQGQARVFVNINGKAGATAFSATPFNIQTTVSQREIELPPIIE